MNMWAILALIGQAVLGVSVAVVLIVLMTLFTASAQISRMEEYEQADFNEKE
ncbi:MAG: hypothetical protein U0O22_01325 [Acutalibacteraceae bacterium]